MTLARELGDRGLELLGPARRNGYPVALLD
jgi:hypothetical protein